MSVGLLSYHFPAGHVLDTERFLGCWSVVALANTVCGGDKSKPCFFVQGLPSAEDSTSLQDRYVTHGLVTCPSASVYLCRSNTCMLMKSEMHRDWYCSLGVRWHSWNSNYTSSITHKSCPDNWSVFGSLLLYEARQRGAHSIASA